MIAKGETDNIGSFSPMDALAKSVVQGEASYVQKIRKKPVEIDLTKLIEALG